MEKLGGNGGKVGFNGGKLLAWYNGSMAYVRKFKTTSGATGVQVCWKRNGEVVKTVHIGSANSPAGVEKLIKQARAVMDEGKNPLFDLTPYDEV